MRENNPRNGIVEVSLKRDASAGLVETLNESVLTLSKNLQAVVRKMLKEAIERKPRTVDVNLMQLAVQVCVAV